MVTIEIKNIDLKDEWDYQRAKLLLEYQGLSGQGLTNEQRDILEKEVSLFIWKEIKKQFPQIEKFCTEKAGQFNLIEKRNFETPIICIHGHFYMQLIAENNKDAWCWESVDLQPYRFYFNEHGYFKECVKKAINLLKAQGYNKTIFHKLSTALECE